MPYSLFLVLLGFPILGSTKSCTITSSVANCTFLNLTSVPITELPPNLISLDLSHNLITDLNAADFKSLAKLQNLFVSYNRLLRIPDFFAPSLQVLALDHNPLTSLVFSNSWKDSNLRHLDISSSAAQELVSGSFAALSHLQRLDLSHSSSIKNFATAQVFPTTLETLILTDINIERIVVDQTFCLAFQNLVNLKNLILNNNSLGFKFIECLSDKVTTKISNLSLAHNMIVEVKEKDWRKLQHLSYLDLTANHIRRLKTSNIGFLTLLQDLRLSQQSGPMQLGQGAFADLSKLQHLDLSNQVLKPKDSVFSLDLLPKQFSLRSLNLSNCGLEQVQLGAGQGLTMLDLANNKLMRICNVTFPKGLTTLKLLGNPFSCTCGDLLWFLPWLHSKASKFLTEKSKYKCSDSEKKLMDLDLRTLCSSTTTSIPTPTTTTTTTATTPSPTTTTTTTTPTTTTTTTPSPTTTTKTPATTTALPVPPSSSVVRPLEITVAVVAAFLLGAILVGVCCRRRIRALQIALREQRQEERMRLIINDDSDGDEIALTDCRTTCFPRPSPPNDETIL